MIGNERVTSIPRMFLVGRARSILQAEGSFKTLKRLPVNGFRGYKVREPLAVSHGFGKFLTNDRTGIVSLEKPAFT